MSLGDVTARYRCWVGLVTTLPAWLFFEPPRVGYPLPGLDPLPELMPNSLNEDNLVGWTGDLLCEKLSRAHGGVGVGQIREGLDVLLRLQRQESLRAISRLRVSLWPSSSSFGTESWSHCSRVWGVAEGLLSVCDSDGAFALGALELRGKTLVDSLTIAFRSQ